MLTYQTSSHSVDISDVSIEALTKSKYAYVLIFGSLGFKTENKDKFQSFSMPYILGNIPTVTKLRKNLCDLKEIGITILVFRVRCRK